MLCTERALNPRLSPRDAGENSAQEEIGEEFSWQESLDGIRVLEAGLLIQGPQAALLLGDMGADVVKIELPGFGDLSRNIRVTPGDPRSAVFTACNRGKRSVSLDLRHSEGAAIFKRLVRDADVVISKLHAGHDGKVGARP